MLHLADMDLSVKVLLTPGHTFEHVCYLVDDKHLFAVTPCLAWAADEYLPMILLRCIIH